MKISIAILRRSFQNDFFLVRSVEAKRFRTMLFSDGVDGTHQLKLSMCIKMTGIDVS